MKIQRARTSLITLLALPVLMTQAARADYQSAVLADGPKAYYRLNDDTTRSNINKNSGSLGAAANLTNTFNLRAFPGAIAGSGNRAQFFHTGTAYGMIPFNPGLNPDNTKPFTIEVWFYPGSDQISTGESPINNRVSAGFPDRTGWVFFKRAPSLDYTGKPGFEGVGWNCRMYRGNAGNTGLDVTSQVPFEVGKWTHVVVIYDPVDPVTNASLTIYINGVAANTNTWTGGTSGTDPGYAANPDVTDAALSLGAYNNTSGAGGNPYFGGIDEFAFYTNKLSPAQILAHYQNGTNANRATPYDTLIQSATPAAYLRLGELPPGPDLAVNLGDVRNTGIATNTAEVRHPAASALGGRADDGASAYHNRNGNSSTTIPWLAANNGLDPADPSTNHAGIPFTLETWFRPMKDQQSGQCPMNNRMVGGTGRTGWVIFQRNPNHSYPVSEGFGWELRMYYGMGTSGDDTRTEVDYKIGEWGHVVWTWEPNYEDLDSDGVPDGHKGDVNGNGNDQWVGTCTAYFNGVPVSTNSNVRYSANRQVPEVLPPSGAPADFAVADNAASNLGANPFEGDVDEVAIYNNYLLTPAQILAHYQTGTNTHPATNYETLVLTAPYDGSGNQRLGPKTYLRFNDPALFPAANNGTLGYLADGNLDLTTNTAAGPRSPAYAGFEASNTALPLNGAKQWASLNNPSGLNISGQITLEAWVQPDAAQPNDPARVISHGPQTLSNFLGLGYDNAVTNSSEVFLQIDGGTNYTVGSAQFVDNVATTNYGASFGIPAGDLGGANWIHLVGTYDGTNWNLYRNGAKVATAAAAVGALPVDIGDWAIGSTGNGWANNFAGRIDEVAIYDTALTPAKVATHYGSGLGGGPAALTITPAGGGNMTITWPAGTTLLQSSLVTGPYTNTPGNPVSPLTVPASGTRFYRSSMP